MQVESLFNQLLSSDPGEPAPTNEQTLVGPMGCGDPVQLSNCWSVYLRRPRFHLDDESRGIESERATAGQEIDLTIGPVWRDVADEVLCLEYCADWPCDSVSSESLNHK
jgi:hypothetical protein